MKNDQNVKKRLGYLLLLLVWAAVLFTVIYLSLTKNVSSGTVELPVYSVDTDKKQAALTFNCAWDDTGLDELLDILKAHDIRSTFFIVGEFAEKYPDAVRKISNAGHELGNHSMKHGDPVKMSYADVVADIAECNELIFSLTGQNVSFYRAPSGSYNSDTVLAARSLGVTAVQWDADSVDWKDISPGDIYRRMNEKIGCGSIALFHVGKENTVAALPDIIEKFEADGFSFVTVSQLLPTGDTYIDGNGKLHELKEFTSAN